MLTWFDTREVERFGNELAQEILATLEVTAKLKDAKFAAKAEKVLLKIDRKVRDFKLHTRLNFYKRSKLANTFLWVLKDGGCPPGYATELTEWLTLRL